MELNKDIFSPNLYTHTRTQYIHDSRWDTPIQQERLWSMLPPNPNVLIMQTCNQCRGWNLIRARALSVLAEPNKEERAKPLPANLSQPNYATRGNIRSWDIIFPILKVHLDERATNLPKNTLKDLKTPNGQIIEVLLHQIYAHFLILSILVSNAANAPDLLLINS